MRKRISSVNSPSRESTNGIESTQIVPLLVVAVPPISECHEHASNANLKCYPMDDDEGSKISKTARVKQKRNVMAMILLSFLSMILFSFSVGILISKTGIAYKNKDGHGHGRTSILSPQEIASPKYKNISKSVSKSTSFAVVVNTFKRPDMLKLSLDHWVNQCGRNSNISQVFVVWAELDKEPPKLEDVLPPKKKQLRSSDKDEKKGKQGQDHLLEDGEVEVEFLRVPKDSLNSRFLPISNLKSDAVFMVDDDVRIDCASISEGFEAWRHFPNALVGYYPRLASPKLGVFESKAEMIYHTWPIVFATQKFNIILTKASFFHKKYLEMYHDDTENPKEVLEYVDAHKNCEDVGMAFLVARKTANSKRDEYCRDCPLYVHGKIKDEGLLNGISTSGGKLSPQGHMEKRSKCLDEMISIYEDRGWDYPLFEVPLGDQSWHHSFWWQNAPSNFFEWFSVGNMLM
jgi:hypothetical protein